MNKIETSNLFYSTFIFWLFIPVVLNQGAVEHKGAVRECQLSQVFIGLQSLKLNIGSE